MKTKNYCLMFFSAVFLCVKFSLAASVIEPVEGVPQSSRFSQCKPLYILDGCSSFIHLCRDAYFDQPVIVKYMREDKSGNLLNEISIFKLIREFRHTIKILDVVDEGQKTFLILEYASGGDLENQLQRASKSNKRVNAQAIFRLVMKAIDELHSNRIAHRDIKPENFFFVEKDGNKYLKIGDFGFSQLVPPGMNSTKRKGTLRFMAPEVFNIGQKTTQPKTTNYDPFKSDIYSAGVMLFCMLTSAHLFESPSSTDVHFRLLQKKGIRGYIKHFQFENLIEEPAIILLENMLHPVPYFRPTAQQVLKYPWLSR